MASFFYADIKTDELQVHGHNPSIPAQIELLDANASNMVIIRAPLNLTQPNVIITLPSNVSTANSLMMNTLGNGELSFISPKGDISMDVTGSFTVNNLSNSATITSYSNIIMSTDKQLQFRDSNNYISSNSTGDMVMKSDSGNIFITATGEVVILSKSNGTVKIINEGVNELGFIVEQPNTYINFGATTGSNGYGIRDNNGVLQIKNRIDSNTYPYEWSNIVSRLDNLQDTNITAVSNGQVLVYNSTQSKWVNSNSIGQLGYYGSFFDTTTQTSDGLTAAMPMHLNSTAEAYGVSIVGTSNIKVDYAGVYNIQFSAQLENTGSGTHPVDIWLTKNSQNLANTNTKITMVGNNNKEVAAWNFVLTLNANDYVTLYWAATDTTQIQLTAEGSASSPARPAVPSVIATVTQVTNIQNGTLRFGDLLNVNDTGKASNSLIQYNTALSQWQAVSNITLDTGNKLLFGSTANISAPVTGNLTLQGSNIDLIVANEVHVHNNLRVTSNIFLDGANTSNISAPTASNLDIKASNVNITGTKLISCLGNVSIGQANKLLFGSTANISAPVTGNLTIQGSNIDLIVSNEVHVHNNLRVIGALFMDGGNTSNISAPTAANLDIKSGNVNIIANSQIVNRVAGQTIYSASYIGSNALINMGSTAGESGIGFKNISTNQIQVKPNSASSWSNIVTHLPNLGDVTFSSLANNNILTYNTTSAKWVNQANVYVRGASDSNGLALIPGTDNRASLYVDWQPGATMASYPAALAVSANGAVKWAAAFNNSKGDNTLNEYIVFARNGVKTGAISNNSTVTAYVTTSDYRLKSNVSPMTNGLDIVNLMNPVNFTWISTGANDSGFIAHELQTVVPSAVTGEKDELAPDGTPEYQGVDTSMLICYMVDAIKQLTSRVSQLESQMSNI